MSRYVVTRQSDLDLCQLRSVNHGVDAIARNGNSNVISLLHLLALVFVRKRSPVIGMGALQLLFYYTTHCQAQAYAYGICLWTLDYLELLDPLSLHPVNLPLINFNCQILENSP